MKGSAFMSVLNDIVNQASIRDLLDYYGIEQNKSTGNYLCPFHNDHNASLSVTKDDKHWQCMTCGASGNVVDLVEQMEKIKGTEYGDHNNYLKRYEFIINLQNLNINFTMWDDKKKKKSPQEVMQDLPYNLLNDAKNIGVETLNEDRKSHGVASRYLASRGISEDTIKFFDIGYDGNAAIQKSLMANYNKYRQLFPNNTEYIEKLYELGIVGKSSTPGQYYDVQYQRVIIPIKDKNGKTVAFGGRSLENNPRAKYLNTKTTELFKKAEILFNYDKAKYKCSAENEIILVEGYFDVVSAHEMGIDNVVGAMGVAVTDEHLELINEINDGRCTITLCFDNDTTGRAKMAENIERLMSMGYEVNVLDTSVLNKGKDMNDFLCAGVSKEQLKECKITAVEYLFRYSFEKLLNGKSQPSVDDVLNVYNEVFSINIVNNSLNEQRFIEYVTNNYGLTESKVKDIIHPSVDNPLLQTVMYSLLYRKIQSAVLKYAEQKDDVVLRYFAGQDRIKHEHITEGFNNPKYLYKENNGVKINCKLWAEEYLKATAEYVAFEQNFDKNFYNVLDNASGFEKSGYSVPLAFDAKQKDRIISQYKASFDNDIIQFLKDNPNRVSRMFVVDDENELQRMFDMFTSGADARDYNAEDKARQFKNFREGKMIIFNYGYCFDVTQLDALSRVYPEKFTTPDGEHFKIVLVYNNSNDELKLKPKNYKENDTVVQSVLAQYGVNQEMGQTPMRKRQPLNKESVLQHTAFSQPPE